ncbi:MAG TPA: riboflavin synthase [Bacillota bacterium]|nr:riboflavin synthase [Bacillota bacterium]
MFTGIIEELGRLRNIKKGSKSALLDIEASEVLGDVKLGDSIAVNGVCLTVTGFTTTNFTADVMNETLQRTNLGSLRPGEQVNLERALKLGDRLGGHIVSGHIDGVGSISSQTREDIAVVTRITADPEVLKYIIVKGSVAIDGISLTVIDVDAGSFAVSLIPHTAKLTTLGFKKPGDKVNLEGDVLGKYVEKLLTNPGELRAGKTGSPGKTGGMDAAFLSEHGFI